MAASHPFLRAKKNPHHQCCTTALAGQVQPSRFSHHTFLQKTKRVFIPAWHFCELPRNLPTCGWALLLTFSIFHRRKGEAVSKPSSWAPHLHLNEKILHVHTLQREPLTVHRLILSTFNGLYRFPHLVLWRTLYSTWTWYHLADEHIFCPPDEATSGPLRAW